MSAEPRSPHWPDFGTAGAHRDLHTGLEYRYDPAVAVVEMVNENSVVEGWVSGRLVGADDRAGQTWSPIPVSYALELTGQHNDWLVQELSEDRLAALQAETGVGPQGQVPRLRPEQFGQASRLRFESEARFYMELEQRFFESMRRLLRDELGIRSMLIGSADHNDSISGDLHIRASPGRSSGQSVLCYRVDFT